MTGNHVIAELRQRWPEAGHALALPRFPDVERLANHTDFNDSSCLCGSITVVEAIDRALFEAREDDPGRDEQSQATAGDAWTPPKGLKPYVLTMARDISIDAIVKIWIIEGILARDELSIWFGEPESGKSQFGPLHTVFVFFALGAMIWLV